MSKFLRYFIDTNIFVYAYDTSAGEKHKKANDLIKKLWQDDNGCVSIQVLQEFFVITTQKALTPLPVNEVIEIISDITFWRVHSPTALDILETIDIKNKYVLSFWDAMIVLSAKRLHCKILFTEDLNHSQFYEGIKVINPFID